MEICYITEMGIEGKIPRNFNNMRTDTAWACSLEADCFPPLFTPEKKYDLAIVIIPKININIWVENDVFSKVKKFADRIAIMQEGPRWYFQDYKLHDQIWYYNSFKSADIILCHNESDKKYYAGITNHSDVRVLPSLMVEDLINNLPEVKREGVMMGGNLVSWYGGFDSFVISSEIQEKIYSPKMGQRQEGEERLGITQLPYLNWVEWIKELNKRKYGIHLMKTHAAGTFALNCAYLGIPCIGYKGLDTQEKCHPSLTVDLGDMVEARKLIRILNQDSNFYNKCSIEAKENYKNLYHEDIFSTIFKKQLEI